MATFHSRPRRCIPPLSSVHFNSRTVFGQFLSIMCFKITWRIIFHSQMCQLWIVEVDFIDLTLKMKIDVEDMQIWTFDIFRNFTFAGLISQFHGLPQFFLFKMLDGHLMHLISWKNLVLYMLFFLPRPLEYVYPHISQWTKTWKNITDNIFSEND